MDSRAQLFRPPQSPGHRGCRELHEDQHRRGVGLSPRTDDESFFFSSHFQYFSLEAGSLGRPLVISQCMAVVGRCGDGSSISFGGVSGTPSSISAKGEIWSRVANCLTHSRTRSFPSQRSPGPRRVSFLREIRRTPATPVTKNP